MPSPSIEPYVVQLLQYLAEHREVILQPGVQRRTLSLHDHWLSKAEAAGISLSFRTLESLQDYRFYLREEDRFVQLLASLFRSSELFYVHPAAGTVQPLTSWAEFFAVGTSGLREQLPFTLYVKSLEVLLASANDLCVSVYFLADRHLASFQGQALAYGLHLL